MLFVLCGLPGTGKSTLAKILAEKLNGVWINSDSVRLKLFEKRTYSEKEKNFVYEKMFEEAERLLKEKREVVLDATFYRSSLREKARALAERTATTAILVECTLPEDEVRKRIMERKDSESEANFEIYKKVKKEFEEISERHLVLDCSLALKAQLSAVLEYSKKFIPNYIDTHISKIYISGDYVYKVKKPVKFSFLDFSTLELRKFYCEEEVRLNRRLCPDVYLGVVKAERHFGGYIFESDVGEEYAVKMKRLPSDKQMDLLLRSNQVSAKSIEEIARIVAQFHEKIEVIREEHYGSPALIQQQINDLSAHRKTIEDAIGAGDAVDLALERCAAFNKKNIEFFKNRQKEGFIRDCHGDLHSANIIIADKIYIFDCIEFNKDFRFIDVASEIAFMAMDLEAFGRKDFSKIFVETYVALTGDKALQHILDYYKCYRANVRLKVAAIEYAQNKNEDAKERMKKYAGLMRDYALALKI